jgi:hypothetical protein
MSFGGYWTVMEKTSVDEVRAFLISCDFDVQAFREFLSEKFNKSLRRPFTNPDDFDAESVRGAILGFKNKYCRNNDLRDILHFLIFHHYMILWHKVFREGELKIMRAKITFYAGKSLDGSG